MVSDVDGEAADLMYEDGDDEANGVPTSSLILVSKYRALQSSLYLNLSRYTPPPASAATLISSGRLGRELLAPSAAPYLSLDTRHAGATSVSSNMLRQLPVAAEPTR